ncbi:hypothetical protein CRUP_006589 [Coryphaenoides rupestris]|nr:hypothetical protein CRUP_006589 [Coryphaenoides rupestris]
MEGGTLSLKPNVSTVHKPITFIRWKKDSDWVVDWNAPDDMMYFGSYKNRANLNIETLQLDINRLTLADSGTFSLETDKGTARTYQVQVILSPPTPQLWFNVCHQDQPCVVMCYVETLHLGPVTFHWRRNHGEWRPDNHQVTLSRPEEPETITCKMP